LSARPIVAKRSSCPIASTVPPGSRLRISSPFQAGSRSSYRNIGVIRETESVAGKVLGYVSFGRLLLLIGWPGANGTWIRYYDEKQLASIADGTRMRYGIFSGGYLARNHPITNRRSVRCVNMEIWLQIADRRSVAVGKGGLRRRGIPLFIDPLTGIYKSVTKKIIISLTIRCTPSYRKEGNRS